MLNFIGVVKRTDLDLRTEYLGLQTKIYDLGYEKYSILVENYKGSFEKLKKHFDYSICPMGTPIELINEEPKEYLKIIDNIPYNDIINNFQGVCLTKPEIDNMLISKFYYIDIIDITSIPGMNARLIITVSDDTESQHISSLEGFVKDMKLSFKEVIVRRYSDNNISTEDTKNEWVHEKDTYQNEPIYCFTDKSYPFSVNDAEFWFSNVEKIYKGDINRNVLPFFNKGETKCYLDFSHFDNINLRNNILLYDKVYISLPSVGMFDKFLEKQNIKRNDLIELVERDKLVFLLPNTETQYDKDFIMDAYRHNHSSVISRRGINALMACYMTEVDKAFFADNPEYRELIVSIYQDLKNIDNKNANELARLLAWPIIGKLESFRTLNHYGPMAINHFGVNTVLEEIIKSREKTNELSFEFVVNSSNIHIATALRATYFPFRVGDNGKEYSDSGVATILANLLNSYYYTSFKEVDKINELANIIQRENNHINLLSIDNTISITKFADMAKKHKTEKQLMDILTRLEKMGEVERREKIADYNTLLCDIAEIPDKERWKCLKYFLGATGLIPTIPQLLSIGIGLADIGLSIIDKSLSNKEKYQLEQIEYKINKATNEIPQKDVVEDIFVLDKISRIAKLR